MRSALAVLAVFACLWLVINAASTATDKEPAPAGNPPAQMSGMKATAARVASSPRAPRPAPAAALVAKAKPSAAKPTYAVLADEAVTSLARFYYDGNGHWRDCPEARCWVHNSDWGSDSLTDTLYLRWQTARDPRIPPLAAALVATARTYAPPCSGNGCLLWSDVPMWDSIAASREHEILGGDTIALAKAKAAFEAVESSNVYDAGACPAIRFQRPYGRGDHLKTLETDSNGVKAALLLYDETRDVRYRQIAVTRYAAIRRYFRDPEVPLYSVYVFDDGRDCTQVPHRYFASVNGNMIWNGLALYRATGDRAYRNEAFETAQAVSRYLSDPSGVFMDLQAENDLAEPLVEAMLLIAVQERGDFARSWLLTSASAAFSARKSDGSYGRFFDGPPPAATVTAWQTSGGLAMEIAAASLDRTGTAGAAAWGNATFVSHSISSLPATIRFKGSGIALIGTLGDVCCQPGHARILVDGIETMNRIGAWQNKSSSGQRLPGSVLFAWGWPSAGAHEVTLLPGVYDAKEGGPYLRSEGYFVR